MASHQSRLNNPDNAGNVSRAKLLYNQYREIYPDFMPTGPIAHYDVYTLERGDLVTFNGAVITATGRFIAADVIYSADSDSELDAGQVGAWFSHK